MNRKEIENKSVCLTQGKFGKPDLYRVEGEGRSLMVKDVRKRNFFLRWTLGLWLIQKEWKIYSRLNGMKGIPQPIERIDRFVFSMEFIPGRPLSRKETLPPSFFSDHPVRHFFILISHILCTVFALPLIMTAVFFALTRRFELHKKVVKFTVPLWLYVSITGVVIYFMLRANS